MGRVRGGGWNGARTVGTGGRHLDGYHGGLHREQRGAVGREFNGAAAAERRRGRSERDAGV